MATQVRRQSSPRSSQSSSPKALLFSLSLPSSLWYQCTDIQNLPLLQSVRQKMNGFIAPTALPSLTRGPAIATCPARSITPRACQGGVPSLLVVGAGVLGREIATQYAKTHPGALVVGETRTDASHGNLRALGVTPALVGEGGRDFDRLVFCAPPSGNEDYPGDVARAAERIAGGGLGVFTSSGSVYEVSADGVLDEDCAVREKEGNPRAAMLLRSEEAMLGVEGGMIVRLAGLYSLSRGAHGFYLREDCTKLGGHGDSFLNLIHYEDAAALVLAALEKGPEGAEGRRVFLGADCSPVMRQEVCEAAIRHPMFKGATVPEFDGEGEVVVKAYDNSETRRVLGWVPKWESFEVFMHDEAAEVAA